MSIRSVAGSTLVCIVIALASNLVFILVAELPRKTYLHNNDKHPLSEDCASVTAGESLSKIVQVLNQHGEAEVQKLDHGQLALQRANLKCIIEFDEATHRSTKNQLVRLPAFEKDSQ